MMMKKQALEKNKTSYKQIITNKMKMKKQALK